jgi:hypothetical protein
MCARGQPKLAIEAVSNQNKTDAYLIEGAAGRVKELWCSLLALAGQQLLQLALIVDPCMATNYTRAGL